MSCYCLRLKRTFNFLLLTMKYRTILLLLCFVFHLNSVQTQEEDEKYPKIHLHAHNYDVISGEDLVIPCDVTGDPTPTVKWFHNNFNIIAWIGSGYTVFENGTLLIRGSSRKDKGKYVCEAANGLDTVNSDEIMVSVKGPPVFSLKPPEELQGTFGSEIELKCIAEGSPEPKLTWYRGIPNEKIPRSSYRKKRQPDGSYVRHFKYTINATVEVLTCVASNEFGSIKSTTQVYVGEDSDIRKHWLVATLFYSQIIIFIVSMITFISIDIVDILKYKRLFCFRVAKYVDPRSIQNQLAAPYIPPQLPLVRTRRPSYVEVLEDHVYEEVSFRERRKPERKQILRNSV